MIDTSENLIIIKGQIKTPEIESCQNHNGNYKVVFRNVPSAYTYKEENVLWLTDPDKPDPNNYQIISKGRTLSNIKALSIFKACISCLAMARRSCLENMLFSSSV